MSLALLAQPISHSSGPLQCDPAPACLFSSLWHRSCQPFLQRPRRSRADFAHSLACSDTLLAAIPGWFSDSPCLNFQILKMVPRI
jgi:hypothetical protein